MIPNLDELKQQWIQRQCGRFPKPHKPKPREEELFLDMSFQVPDKYADELQEYMTDAFLLWQDSKGL